MDKILLSLIFALLFGCADQGPITASRYLLGTSCRITTYNGASAAELEDIFDEIENLESRMHSTREGSEIARINASAGIKPETVSKDTFLVLKTSIELAKKSNGAFDPTLGPIIQAWGLSISQPQKPSPEQIQSLLPLVGFQMIRTKKTTRSVFLEKPDMALDLGGIAKGYAADLALKRLNQIGVRSAIIDFGGNILLLGKKGIRPWKAGVQNPFKSRGAYLGIIHASDQAIVTSGIYERFLEEDGILYHHILNSKDGYPVQNDVAGITVVSKSSLLADGLSTTLFVLGPEKSREFIKDYPNVGVIFVMKDKEVVSINMGKQFVLTDESFTLR